MINDRLSKNLQVKPLKDGETVTYKVKGAGEPLPGHVDEYGNKRLAAPGLDLSGECFITDKWGDNPTAKVQLIHALEYKTVTLPDMTVQQVPIPARFVFNNGYLTVTFSQFESYAFAERHPNNGSNKYRDKTKKIKFYRMDAKAAKLQKYKINARVDAAIGILGDADKAGVSAIARFINKTLAKESKLNLDQEILLLKGDIRDRILEKHPDLVIMGSGEANEKKKIQAQMAEEFNIIEFDEEITRNWFFGDREIAHADVSEDRYDMLVKAFIETKGLFKEITDALKVAE